MNTTRIHINQVNIRHNQATGEKTPVITVRHPDGSYSHGNSCVIQGPSTIVYNPNPPAIPTFDKSVTVWIETEAKVSLL